MLYYQYERSYCLTRVVYTAQKMMFSIKDFFSKCDQIHTFTEEILNGKLHFVCSVIGLFFLLKNLKLY